jgi:tRNA(Leu) C34 or U34 (ribose-2'-O)-methylase TrmL
MPSRILEKHPDRIFRVPMNAEVRSLNLATAVGIVLYEAIRRVGLSFDDKLEQFKAAVAAEEAGT